MLNATQRIFASVLFLLLVSAMITGGALARLNGPSAVGIDGVRIFSRGIPISDGQFIAQTVTHFILANCQEAGVCSSLATPTVQMFAQ